MKNLFEPFENLGKVKADLSEYQEIIEPDPQIEPEDTRLRTLWWLYLLLGIVFVVLAFRLWQLQIKEGWQNKVLAKDNRIRSQVILPPRGEILDTHGKVLATNVAGFALQILPTDLPKDYKKRQEIYQKIQQVTQVEDQVFEKIESELLHTIDPITVAQTTDREEMMFWKLRLQEIPATEVVAVPERQYQSQAGLAHILGYVGKLTEADLNEHPEYPRNSLIGKTGLELSYDQYLRGKPGCREVEVDSMGRLQRVVGKIPPLPGDSLILNLDLDLQEVLAQSLEKAIESSGGKSGAAVALNPQNGAVLALVSWPSYDNNLFVPGKLTSEDYQAILEDPTKPLLNRVLAGLYPSGSAIKPVIAAAALEEKVIAEDTAISTPPEIVIGQWHFPDWKYHPGYTDVRRAIAESNNIFFYALGGGYGPISGLGAERLAEYLRKFGFESTTGIDLPGEKSGLVPTPEWKEKTKGEKWYLGDTYHLAIGQGDLLVTPLEMAVATAAIANGGNLVVPHLVSRIVKSNGEEVMWVDPPPKAQGIVSDNTVRIVREGMRQTVTSGSARLLADLPLAVAGKTGTAQYGGPDQTHAWFTCFAPYENPQIVLVVFVEAGGQGHATAAPVAKEVLRWYNENRLQH